MSKQPTKKTVRKYEARDLIEWLAAIAHEGKRDWGFIADELMRRLKGKPHA